MRCYRAAGAPESRPQCGSGFTRALGYHALVRGFLLAAVAVAGLAAAAADDRAAPATREMAALLRAGEELAA